jgi:hypothetical protein
MRKKTELLKYHMETNILRYEYNISYCIMWLYMFIFICAFQKMNVLKVNELCARIKNCQAIIDEGTLIKFKS